MCACINFDELLKNFTSSWPLDRLLQIFLLKNKIRAESNCKATIPGANSVMTECEASGQGIRHVGSLLVDQLSKKLGMIKAFARSTRQFDDDR